MQSCLHRCVGSKQGFRNGGCGLRSFQVIDLSCVRFYQSLRLWKGDWKELLKHLIVLAKGPSTIVSLRLGPANVSQHNSFPWQVIKVKPLRIFNLRPLYLRVSTAKPATERVKPWSITDPKGTKTNIDRLLKIERKSVHISADKDLQGKAASTDAWAANKV